MRLEELPNPKFPLLFYGSLLPRVLVTRSCEQFSPYPASARRRGRGQDLQEGDSPSFFNPHEAVVVADLVDKLIRDKRLSEHDVGVISPSASRT